MKKGLIILSLLLLIFSCGDIENCGADRSLDVIIIQFFDKDTKEAKTVGFDIFSNEPTVQFLLPEVEKINNGDTTYVREAQTLYLPLNVESESITYFFNSDSSSFELVLSYEKEFSLFDPDCDPSLMYINLDTISQTFDSTAIVSQVTQFINVQNSNQPMPNFEIYF